MDATLIASAALMGLAGAPHCTAMCAAPCTAVLGRHGAGGTLVFHLARVGAYAAAGAVVSAGTGALAALTDWSPALRPLWTALHLAALLLGLWLLWQGRPPAWLGAVGLGGRRTAPAVAPAATGSASPVLGVVAWPAPRVGAGTGQPPRGGAAALPRAIYARLSWAPALAGLLWVGWPCGLLHSALLVAAMTNTATSGAAAMGGFALASSLGLLWAPWLWRRLGAGGTRRAEAWAARLAGAMLVAAALFALGHGLWHEVAVLCGWA
jgi:sulfite exporter TauE/SafE